MSNPKLIDAPGDVIWTSDLADRAAWVDRVATWSRANRTRVTFADIDAERERRSQLRKNWRASHRADTTERGRGRKIADKKNAERVADGPPRNCAEQTYFRSEREV